MRSLMISVILLAFIVGCGPKAVVSTEKQSPKNEAAAEEQPATLSGLYSYKLEEKLAIMEASYEFFSDGTVQFRFKTISKDPKINMDNMASDVKASYMVADKKVIVFFPADKKPFLYNSNPITFTILDNGNLLLGQATFIKQTP